MMDALFDVVVTVFVLLMVVSFPFLIFLLGYFAGRNKSLQEVNRILTAVQESFPEVQE